MTDDLLDSYVEYFSRRVRAAKKEIRLLWWSGPLLLVILATLAVFLRSGPMVWVVLALLYGLGFWGVRTLRSAVQVVIVACEHLRDVAEQCKGVAANENVPKLLRSQIRPEDDSNVPEALLGLATQPGSGGARAASHAAFARPSAELATAVFVRNALVLGGLFGTVFFFAVELAGGAAQAGDLRPVLEGLRGALASTLTGIFGSLVIGYFISRLDRIVDETTWETEAFLNGPFSEAIARGDLEGIKTEPELWEGLRAAVADLANRTGKTYDTLAGEVAAYSVGLTTLTEQMRNLPSLKFPPQLTKLDSTVERFAQGVESLGSSSEALIAAVGTLGLFAPAKTLQELGRIAEASELQYKESASRLGELASELGVATQSIAELTTVVSRVPPDLSERIEMLEAASRQTSSLVAEASLAIRDGQEAALEGMDKLSDGQRETLGTMQEIRASLGGTPDLLSESITQLKELLASLSKSASDFQELTLESTQITEHLQNLELASVVVQGRLESLQSVTQKLDRLDSLYTMCDRAGRAPLLRLLLLSFGRDRNGASARAGNATPS